MEARGGDVMNGSPGRGALRAFGGILVTVLLLAAAGGAAYYQYVKSRQAMFTARDYRSLTLLGRQLEKRMDAYGEMLLARKAKPDFNGCASFQKPTERFSSLFRCGLPEPPPIAFMQRPGVETPPELEKLFVRERDGTRVYLCTRYVPPTTALWIPEDLRLRAPGLSDPPRDENGVVVPVCMSTTFQQLLDSTSVWHRFGFDALTVVSHDGKVLAQAGSLTHPVTDLGNGIAAAKASQGKDHTAGATGKDAGAGGADDKGSSQKSWGVELASQPASTLLAGDRYLLLSWGPMQYYDGVAGTLAGERLWLAGFVREAPFTNAVWRIPYAALLASLLGLMLVAFSWPLLKVWYLASRERLRAFDVHLVALGLITLTGAATLVLLAMDAHQQRSHEQSEELATFAKELEKRFRQELDETSKQISANPVNELCNRTPYRPCEAPKRVVTRHLNSILLIDSGGAPKFWYTATTGKAAGTWRVEPSNLTKLSLAGRPYFSDAQKGNLWRVGPVELDATRGRETPMRKLTAEVVLGKFSGRFELVVARPLGPPGYPKPSVVAASTNLWPLFQPILPQGVGFAIINELGDVLLHSDNSRNLAENLFEEVADSAHLKAAVKSGEATNLGISYSGNDYTAYLRPMQRAGERLPWSIVAFRDKTILQTMNSETLIGAIVSFGGYLLAFVLGFVVMEFADPRYPAAWLWPARDRHTVVRYTVLGLALAVLALATFRLVDVQGVGALPLVVPAVSALAVAWCCLTLGPTPVERYVAATVAIGAGATVWWSCWSVAPWFCLTIVLVCAAVYAVTALLSRSARNAAEAAAESIFQTAYTFFVTSMLLVLAAVPAALFARDTIRQVDGSARSVAARYADDRFRDRDVRIFGRRGDDQDWVIEERRADQSDVYHPPARDGGARSSDVLLSSYVQDYLPALGDLSAELHHARHVDVEVATATLSRRAGAAGVVLAALVFALVWAVTRRVFLLDVDASGAATVDGAPPGRTPLCWRLRTRVGAKADTAVSVSAPALLDCRAERSLAEWRQQHAPAKKGEWHVRHFETALEDPVLRAQLLELLEELVYRTDVRVVIDSDQDPIRSLVHGLRASTPKPSSSKGDGASKQSSERAPAAEGQTAGAGAPPETSTLVRWLRVLSDFETATFHEAGDGSRSEADHWLWWRRLSRSERLAVRQLADEGFLNPNNAEVARSLIQQGMVRRDRTFKLATPGFSSFVRRVVPADTVTRWEQDGAAGGWDSLRGHLASALALAGAFVFITQPDLFNNVLLTAAGVTAGVPTLLKAFSLLGDQRSGSRTA